MTSLVRRGLRMVLPSVLQPQAAKRVVLIEDLPECKRGIDEGHRLILESTFDLLENLGGRRQKIAVLAPSEETVSRYAHCIATHFYADLEVSGALLCNGHDDLRDVCECMEDYFLGHYGLVVAVVDHDLVGQLAGTLSERLRRPVRQVHKFSTLPTYYVI